MKRQLAIKCLTASDLTLFEWHFRNNNAGNQKAINLNADIFVKTLYPSLAEMSASRDGRFGVDLFIYGPDCAAELNLQRKVIKDTSYKNWRLDGEMIGNPIGEETRFNSLAKGDLAVIEFTGGEFPVSARMVLLAAGSLRDAIVHHALAPLVTSMAAVTVADLAKALTPVAVADDHPIHHLLVDAALEDAALGGAEGTERLFRRRQARRVSRSELAQARQRAGDIGYQGETLVQAHLEQTVDAGELASFVWVADQNAVAPFDFELTATDGKTSRIDVKATTGGFERTLHVSLAELHMMNEAGTPYRIYRLYDMDEKGGTLRVSEPLEAFARKLIGSLAGLPAGVSPDGFSLDPSLLAFGPPIQIQLNYEPAA